MHIHQPDIVVDQGPFEAMCRSAFDWVASDPDRLLLVTGSLYLVGAVRKWYSGDDSLYLSVEYRCMSRREVHPHPRSRHQRLGGPETDMP